MGMQFADKISDNRGFCNESECILPDHTCQQAFVIGEKVLAIGYKEAVCIQL